MTIPSEKNDFQSACQVGPLAGQSHGPANHQVFHRSRAIGQGQSQISHQLQGEHLVTEEAFEKRISGLGLPERVKISHAPFFENPDYRLEILFRDGKVLGETVKNLARINELEGICDPWEEGS